MCNFDKRQRRTFFGYVYAGGLLLFALLPVLALAQKEESHKAAAEALLRLKQGNKRFVSGKLQDKDFKRERATLVQGQQPYAIILSCSDSRVPPELLFDESLGELFVIRVAGNVVDSVVLGSIEYAAEHLHVPLLLVLGHESCGAVKATMQATEGHTGGHVPPNIGALVQRITPSVEKVNKSQVEEHHRLEAAIEENVRKQIQNLFEQSELLDDLMVKKELWVVGGLYGLQSGKVELLSERASTTEGQAAHEHSQLNSDRHEHKEER